MRNQSTRKGIGTPVLKWRKATRPSNDPLASGSGRHSSRARVRSSGIRKSSTCRRGSLFDRCQTDELQTGGIEVVMACHRGSQCRQNPGSFDQRYEALLRRFRASSLQRDGRAVRSRYSSSRPLHVRREIRLPGSGNDHCIPAKAERGRSDADYAFVKRVGDDPRLLASSEPHSRKARIPFRPPIGIRSRS